MAGVIGTRTRELPVLVAGAGPAGASTATMLRRAGSAVHVFEARGEEATRARNIFMRPQARQIVADLLGSDPGRDTTIMSLENRLRAVARAEHVPIDYHHRVVDVVDRGDHVVASVQRSGSEEIREVRGRMFVDASGGRLAATNAGELERLPVGPSHVYVTAQYDTPAPFGKVFGAFDRRRDEGMFFFPVSDGKGFVAYYDLPPGTGVVDEAGLLARYDTLAGRLQLGTPVTPPQVFDAQQHLSLRAAEGRILKIGDSAGNADPYIGAGVAAALVDARAAARALSGTEDPVRGASIAARDVLAGHRNLGAQAGFMRDTRSIGLRMLPSAHFDERLSRADLGSSTGLDVVTRFLTSRPIRQ